MGRIARRKRGFRDGKRMRILSMLFGNNSGGGASSILDGAPFKAQLITSLILNMGTGSPTYTRATTATFTDHEGVLRTAKAGEARFQGARRVRNLVEGSSENLSAAGWVTSVAGTGVSVTVTPGNTDVPSGTSAITSSRVQLNKGAGTGGGDFARVYNLCNYSGSMPSTGFVRKLYMKSNTGLDQNVILNYPFAGAGGKVTVTSSWTAFPGPIGSYFQLSLNGGVSGVADTADILVTMVQVEDRTGASDTTTPSEYVSVGVLSSPYHGAGVDGVKYFSTFLNNTPISSSTAKYASLPGVAGSYFSTPNSVANSITGDIDIRLYIRPNGAWNSGTYVLLSKQANAGTDMAYEVLMNGSLLFRRTSDGVTNDSAISSVALTTVFGSGVAGYLKITCVAATGKVNFYTSADGVAWSILGVEQTITAGAIYNSTRVLAVGARADGNAAFSGKIYQAQIYNSIGGTTPVVNFNANDYSTGTTWAASGTGETWTINGGATVFGAGASAPFDATGPKGYLSEGSRQNICLQSNAFTTTWASSLGGLTQNAVGPDGATSAWTFTDNSAVAVQYASQAITLTAASYTFSVLVKKTIGAQSSYPLIATFTGTTWALATIDTSNGVATPYTAWTGNTILAGVSASCVSYNANYWLVALTYTATAASYTHLLVPAATSNATQSTGTWDSTIQGSAVFYGAQVELGSFASTYIPTTTVAVTRNADVLTYATSGNLNVSVGWAYAECVAGQISATGVVIGDSGSTNGSVIYLDSANAKYSSYDGTTAVVTNPAQTIPASATKICVTWSGSSRLITSGGLAATSGSFDGAFASASISIGSQNSGSNGFFGTIRNVRIGQVALSSGTLGALTQ